MTRLNSTLAAANTVNIAGLSDQVNQLVYSFDLMLSLIGIHQLPGLFHSCVQLQTI